MLLKMIVSFILPSLSCLLAQALFWPLLEGNLMSLCPPTHSAPHRVSQHCPCECQSLASFCPLLYIGIMGDVVSQGGEDTREPPGKAREDEKQMLGSR